jgi:hypothetical protein
MRKAAVVMGIVVLVALVALVGQRVGLTGTLAAGGGVITGDVRGPDGPEAGVWVIAETTDLETHFRKIVVTDDDGRFLLPDLPDARYTVWVRGYGLVDSEPLPARTGDELNLAVQTASTPQEAARVYPANYWYSLLEVPAESEFPGAGGEGGINPGMRTQAHWVDRLKDGCQLCHQMGNLATREILEELGSFESTFDAWSHRLRIGGGTMMAPAVGMGLEPSLRAFSDWTDRIKAGEVPPAPPRPQGIERNLVLTMWGWSTPDGFVHDNVATDKRDPTLYPYGPIYGADMRRGFVTVADPVAHTAYEVPIPTRDGDLLPAGSYETASAIPSPYWGEGAPSSSGVNVHNPMMDARGRVWLTSSIRDARNQPEWCREGSDHPSARYFPSNRSDRQISYYDTGSGEFTLIDSCYGTHHLQFAEDEDDTLWFSGDMQVVGWLNTRVWDETGDEQLAQGWCPTVIDTSGDGRITRPWNEPGGDFDPSRDTRIAGFVYGINYNPADGSIWFARRGVPGRIFRLEVGDNPPETCITEVYEPPFQNAEVDASQWGFNPRGIDLDRNGIVWTALSGSGHLASFDRSRCEVLNGPTATGQHCPEGWTLHPTPGPQFRGVTASGSADFHYYNWVDQFNTLGLGENIPIANGTTSDALLALLPETGEWVVMRVPYPLGFYSRLLNGRIDDPRAGWKGRGVWASYDTLINWHNEGGLGTTSQIVQFQMRPDPLAR